MWYLFECLYKHLAASTMVYGLVVSASGQADVFYYMRSLVQICLSLL